MHSLNGSIFACIALSLMLLSACRNTDPGHDAGAQKALTPPPGNEQRTAKENATATADDADKADPSRFVRSADLERKAYVMAKASITCSDAERALDCSMGNPDNGDTFEVRMYAGCGAAGLFGGVTVEANLFDRYPPKSGAWPASFQKGQFVCILAEAGSADEAYLYYVVETPTASVADCAQSSLCKDYGRRSVKWNVPTTGAECRATGTGAFEGDCAMGWVEADKIEAFTMGLIPEPDYRQPQG